MTGRDEGEIKAASEIQSAPCTTLGSKGACCAVPLVTKLIKILLVNRMCTFRKRVILW